MRKTLFALTFLTVMILIMPIAAFAENNANIGTNVIIASNTTTANANGNTAAVAIQNATIGIAIATTANTGPVVMHAILQTNDATALHQHNALIAANNDTALHSANGIICANNANPSFIREAQPAFTAPSIKACATSPTIVANAAPGLTKGGFAANTAAEKVPIRA